MRINADNKKALTIGRQGEKNVTTVAFDVRGWIEQFGTGTFTLLHQRSGDDGAYPVKTVLEDGELLWTIDEADVFKLGIGVAQLMMMVDGKVVKSELYKTSTSQSLNETKKPPEAWKAWVDSIFEAVGTYPRINTVGNWEVFMNGAWTDSGVSAKGKVPVKGVDYFDGRDGRDGRDGTDGRDGRDGVDGLPGRDGTDGHTPAMTGSKEGKTSTVYADGVPLINVQDGEGGGIVDVTVNGTSIVTDGVASIPDADEGKRGVFRSSNFYGTYTYNGILMPVSHSAQQFSNDPNNFFIGKGTLNSVLATPSIMPTLTDAEKAAARERIGLDGKLQLISDITLTETVGAIEVNLDNIKKAYIYIKTSPDNESYQGTLAFYTWEGNVTYYLNGLFTNGQTMYQSAVAFAGDGMVLGVLSQPSTSIYNTGNTYTKNTQQLLKGYLNKVKIAPSPYGKVLAVGTNVKVYGVKA